MKNLTNYWLITLIIGIAGATALAGCEKEDGMTSNSHPYNSIQKK